jgi:flagellar hook-associated protein 1 FlgK
VNNIETSTTTPAYDNYGNPGIPFFTGTSAATMQVNPAITADPGKIAAAGSIDPTTGRANPGDGSIATAIANLQNTPAAGQTETLQAQYDDIISKLGVDSQQAQANVQTGALVLQNLTAQQSSVSSVSLDQEATNLIQYQHAYQAAAHVISVFDQTIGDMINQLGG